MNCPVCGSTNSEVATACAACGIALEARTGTASCVLPTGAALRGGDYIIDRVLGQGGFGITYLASEPRLQRRVAIKEFFLTGTCSRQGNAVHPITGVLTASDFSQSRTNFLEEGQKLARFHHPGIVGVYSIFEENNTAYIVMEYLNGRSLQSIIDSQGRLPVQDAIDHLRSIAGALETVHQTNLLHLDIKPDNIMVCDDGRAVLIDFGISRDFSVRHTVTNQGFCTPGFAPLEQYGQKVRSKPSTDVYALAATFYCALTGEAPVAAPDRASGVDIKPPSRINPQVSASVDQAITWAMEMSDGKRPQSVQDFWNAVQGKTPVVQHTVQMQNAAASPLAVAAVKSTSTSRSPGVAVTTSNSSLSEQSVFAKHGVDRLAHRDAFVQHFKLGQYIQAIKVLREDTNLSLKEALDEVNAMKADMGIPVKSGCYIATACYGDPAHPNVQVLRRFRDNVLLCSLLGIRVTHAYYASSPTVAIHLRRLPWATWLVRWILLQPFVSVCALLMREQNSQCENAAQRPERGELGYRG